MRRSAERTLRRLVAVVAGLAGIVAGGCAPHDRVATEDVRPAPDVSSVGLLEVPVPRNPVGQRYVIEAGQHPVRVEVADHRDQRRIGLAFRSSLEEDAGMLFMYSVETDVPFVMKDCRIGLDIAFIDPKYKIISIASLDPPLPGSSTYESAIPEGREHYSYVLEMNKGWFSRHGVLPGARIHLSDDLKVRAAHAER